LGRSFQNIARRIDADVLELYHDQSTRLLRFDNSTANYVKIYGGGGTGYGTIFYANGTDADPYFNLESTGKITIKPTGGQDCHINTSGGGVFKFGDYTVKGAEAFDGFITIEDDASNVRKLMTCA